MAVLSTAIYIGARPHVGRPKFNIEVFNSVVHLICSYHVLILTGYIQDTWTAFMLGYSFTAFVVLLIFVNLGRVVGPAVVRGYHKAMYKFKLRRRLQELK